MEPAQNQASWQAVQARQGTHRTAESARLVPFLRYTHREQKTPVRIGEMPRSCANPRDSGLLCCNAVCYAAHGVQSNLCYAALIEMEIENEQTN